MKDFFSHSRREIARLKREAKALEAKGKESESLAKLCLAEEIETAMGIVRGAILNAINLNFIGALK